MLNECFSSIQGQFQQERKNNGGIQIGSRNKQNEELKMDIDVANWVVEFKRGRSRVKDAPRSSKPKSATDDKTV